jgi:hypothetical protein
MKKYWKNSYYKRTFVLMACVCGLIAVQPVVAQDEIESTAEPKKGKSFFTPRRILGAAFIGGSVFLAKQGFDYNDEADELYDLYQVTNDPEEADRLYRRTTNRDVKSQVSWALSAAFALSGARLLLAKSGAYERRDFSNAIVKGVQLEPRLDQHGTVLHLRKIWEFF